MPPAYAHAPAAVAAAPRGAGMEWQGMEWSDPWPSARGRAKRRDARASSARDDLAVRVDLLLVDLPQLGRALVRDHVDGRIHRLLVVVGDHVLAVGQMHVDVHAVAELLGL